MTVLDRETRAPAASQDPDVEGHEAMVLDVTCPNCRRPGMMLIYEAAGVPVHSVLLMETKEEALAYPRGDIRLGACSDCGFVGNTAFRPEVHEYSARYESTQAFSPTFNHFHRSVAQQLVDRYDLQGKRVLEIGCGQGEFLLLLRQLADIEGIGFDPAYAGRAAGAAEDPKLTFIADFYTEQYADYTADLVCCKMTLEHIDATADFVATVRQAIGDRPETAVFFQIPNGAYVLLDLAFWDIYYEHCSYFTPAALRYLFESNGFTVLDMASHYADQYLSIECRPTTGDVQANGEAFGHELANTQRAVDYFTDNIMVKRGYWRKKLDDARRAGKRVVIWGSGSKGVAFLTTLRVTDEVAYVVDINPNRQGTYMAGTGHEIVSPAFLTGYKPDLVIVMNPIYAADIQQDLDRLGVDAEVVTV